MKLCFILTAYDRIDDLLAHIDILKYYNGSHEIIPIWMRKDVPSYFLQEMKKHKYAHYCDGIKFSTGPLLALCSGLRIANKIGAEYVLYRNGDDWLFNHQFVSRNIEIMDTGKDIAAYNWLTNNTMIEFAMNEMILRVEPFMEGIDAVEKYITNSSEKLCELKIAKWIKQIIKSKDKFYRLPDREIDPGIGFEIETFAEAFRLMNREMPEGFLNTLEDNHRFFNKKWQLIGSHNNLQRLRCYKKIRDQIPYVHNLERESNFSRWLNDPSNWNLPIDMSKRESVNPTLHRSKMPLFFRKLPKVYIPKMLPSLRRNK